EIGARDALGVPAPHAIRELCLGLARQLALHRVEAMDEHLFPGLIARAGEQLDLLGVALVLRRLAERLRVRDQRLLFVVQLVGVELPHLLEAARALLGARRALGALEERLDELLVLSGLSTQPIERFDGRAILRVEADQAL